MKRLSILLLGALLMMMSGAPTHAQGTLIPFAPQTFVDANGNPLSGAKLCSYAAGTTTPQATYSSNVLTVPNQNTNPVIMAADGRPTSGAIFLSPTSYKFVFREPGTTTDCTTGTILWTLDNVTAVPTTSGAVDVSAVAGETIGAGLAAYLSDGSGGKVAGQWYKADSGNGYSSTLPVVGLAPAAIASGATGTIRIAGTVTDLSGLTPGSTYFIGSAGAITATPPTLARPVGQADTTTSLVTRFTPAVASTASPGMVGLLSGSAKTFWDGSGAYSTSTATTYTATLANVSNSAAKTTIASFTVPANAWSAGDTIDIWLVNLEKNNKGSGGTAAIVVQAGAGAEVSCPTATTFNNSATEFTNRRPVHLVRVGADVQVFCGADEGRASWSLAQDNVIVNSAGASTPTNFTSSFTVSIKATLSAADATFYIKPQAAVVQHFKN